MQNYWIQNIDPIIFKLGSLPIRWYGLMYILGFIAAYFILMYRQKRDLLELPSSEAVQDMMFYGFCGLLIGGRLGECILYDPIHYITRPWEMLMVWHGGMSSHGGFVGAVVAMFFFTKKYKITLLHLLDNIAIAATPGLFFGRIGNFINSELIGKVYNGIWGVIYPVVDNQPRHPVQIYQALSEGLLIFLILMFIGRKKRSTGMLAALFGILYSIVRVFTETFREPSEILAGPVWIGLTKGQVYSVITFLIFVAILIYSLIKGRLERQ